MRLAKQRGKRSGEEKETAGEKDTKERQKRQALSGAFEETAGTGAGHDMCV